MLSQILQKTPFWVWALLVGLISLGLTQTRDRILGLRRLILTPITMTAFSIYGIVSTFGTTLNTLGPWWMGCTGMAALIFRSSNSSPIDQATDSGRYAVPGSWVPLGVILAIFFTKYVTGVLLSIRPSVVQDTTFVLVMCGLYGLFSGYFVGRVLAVLHRPQQYQGGPVVIQSRL